MTQPDMPFRAEEFGPFKGEIVTVDQAAEIANAKIREWERCEKSPDERHTPWNRQHGYYCAFCERNLIIAAPGD